MANSILDFNVENATSRDLADLNRALNYLDQSPTGSLAMEKLANSDTTININHVANDSYNLQTDTINWDPTAGNTLNQLNNSTLLPQVNGVMSPALALAHEAVHSEDPNFIQRLNTSNPQYESDAESLAINAENKIAADLGEPQRDNHDSSAVPGVYVTQHTTTSPDGSTGWVYSNDSGNTVSLSNTFQTIGQDPLNPNPISALGVTTRGVVSDGQANFSADSGVLNQGDTWSSNPQSLTYGLGPQYSIGQASNTPADNTSLSDTTTPNDVVSQDFAALQQPSQDSLPAYTQYPDSSGSGSSVSDVANTYTLGGPAKPQHDIRSKYISPFLDAATYFLKAS